MKRRKTDQQYGPELRGLAINKYGGKQLQRERGFRGAKPPKPSRGYVYTEEEKRTYEAELRKRGKI